MRVFESCSIPDRVVEFARTAISLLAPDDPLVVRLKIQVQNTVSPRKIHVQCSIVFTLIQATLRSKIFQQELKAANSEKAYCAMLENPDPSRFVEPKKTDKCV